MAYYAVIKHLLKLLIGVGAMVWPAEAEAERKHKRLKWTQNLIVSASKLNNVSWEMQVVHLALTHATCTQVLNPGL